MDALDKSGFFRTQENSARNFGKCIRNMKCGERRKWNFRGARELPRGDFGTRKAKFPVRNFFTRWRFIDFMEWRFSERIALK